MIEKLAAFTEINSLISLVSKVPGLKRCLPSPEDSSGIGGIMGLAKAAVDVQYGGMEEKTVGEARILQSWKKSEVSRKEAVEELTIAL